MTAPQPDALPPLNLKTPGLFVTATGTEVGKTITTCAIAAALVKNGHNVGVSKPLASDCRLEDGQLINQDAEALKHFCVSHETLDVINPVRFMEPLAPAVAAELENTEIDYRAIADSLERLDRAHNPVVVEGVGGLMVPLDDQVTVLDLARWIGYPVLVVVGPELGTLNHTALTCKVIRDAGLPLAGIVINRFDPDTADIAQRHNPDWLARQNQTPILCTLPGRPDCRPHLGQIDQKILDAAASVDWYSLCQPPVLCR
ncbi:MAG: dethiobiotin synthase [Planctomycetota bacterium]|jgi:dethiobiotin synthetase